MSTILQDQNGESCFVRKRIQCSKHKKSFDWTSTLRFMWMFRTMVSHDVIYSLIQLQHKGIQQRTWQHFSTRLLATTSLIAWWHMLVVWLFLPLSTSTKVSPSSSHPPHPPTNLPFLEPYTYDIFTSWVSWLHWQTWHNVSNQSLSFP